MQLKEINQNIYEQFWRTSSQRTFLSSVKIGELRAERGWQVYYLGLYKEETLIGAGMLLGHPWHFHRMEFYCPRGFLLDYDNQEELDFFMKEIKKFCLERKGYVLRMDPYLISQQRDIDGKVVADGEDHRAAVEQMKAFGFRKREPEQVTWMFSMDVKGKTPDEILSGMKQNTKRNIKKAEKRGVYIREVEYEELDLIARIEQETSERRNFSGQGLAYLQQMYHLFHDTKEVRYVVAEIDLNQYIKELETEKASQQKTLTNPTVVSNEKKTATIQKNIARIEENIAEAVQIMEEEKTSTVVLGGSMFMMVKPEVTYVVGGSYTKYVKFDAQYLIQWDMIKYAIANEFDKYNFYGIPEHVDEHPGEMGVYEFKKGFTGYVEELIGEYELPLHWTYALKKIKRAA